MLRGIPRSCGSNDRRKSAKRLMAGGSIHCQPRRPAGRANFGRDCSRAVSKRASPGYRAGDERRQEDPHAEGQPLRQAAARLSRPEGRRRRRRSGRAPPSPPGEPEPDGLVRLYGLHTVRAALDNPRRKIRRMLVTRNALERLEIADLAALPFPAELVEPREIDRITGSEAVHQGVAHRGRAAEAEAARRARRHAAGAWCSTR